ncbi:hypothetical protein M413DRAFT_30601 [Hebeloma cylindrosporum]|uniref:Uncharacterized protein n=1 Tax=Hebeloma cylindrosporum TaxID=76867 RepID=A0A0C2XJH3_HEBCY|nr:hypothetical protein M413DRAFT_30601 [Hebeloma cylindrosporum h7]
MLPFEPVEPFELHALADKAETATEIIDIIEDDNLLLCTWYYFEHCMRTAKRLRKEADEQEAKQQENSRITRTGPRNIWSKADSPEMSPLIQFSPTLPISPITSPISNEGSYQTAHETTREVIYVESDSDESNNSRKRSRESRRATPYNRKAREVRTELESLESSI